MGASKSSSRKRPLIKAGDKANGPCYTCKIIGPITYRYKRYHYGKFYLPEKVLVGCCDRCGRISHIPHQETPKIGAFRVRMEDAGKLRRVKGPDAFRDMMEKKPHGWFHTTN